MSDDQKVENVAAGHSRRFTKREVNFNLYSKELSIVATDLSGFTYLTKKYGAIHFASVIVRMRQLLLPIITALSPLTVITEADSFIIVYENKLHAFFCGLLIKQMINSYNATIVDLSDSQPMGHYRIRMDGIGIDCGTGIYHDTSANKVYGGDGAFHTAHLLGEEVANDGEFLISQRFYDGIRREPFIANQKAITFLNKATTYDGHNMNVIKVDGNCEQFLSLCNASNDIPITWPIKGGFPALTDTTFLAGNQKGLLGLCSRYNFVNNYASVISATDKEIREAYTITKCTSIMFAATIECRKTADDQKQNAGGKEAVPDLKSLAVKQQTLCKLLSDVYDKFPDLIEFGGTFLLFHGGNAIKSAMECAMRLQKAIRSFNSDNGKYVIEVSGIGVHMGDILFIPATDIVFGDAINTASKLGEDCAKNADIVITSEVYDVYTDVGKITYGGLKFDAKTFTVSKNEIKGYIVSCV